MRLMGSLPHVLVTAPAPTPASFASGPTAPGSSPVHDIFLYIFWLSSYFILDDDYFVSFLLFLTVPGYPQITPSSDSPQPDNCQGQCLIVITS
jgi:hypothetical protein